MGTTGIIRKNAGMPRAPATLLIISVCLITGALFSGHLVLSMEADTVHLRSRHGPAHSATAAPVADAADVSNIPPIPPPFFAESAPTFETAAGPLPHSKQTPLQPPPLSSSLPSPPHTTAQEPEFAVPESTAIAQRTQPPGADILRIPSERLPVALPFPGPPKHRIHPQYHTTSPTPAQGTNGTPSSWQDTQFSLQPHKIPASGTLWMAQVGSYASPAAAFAEQNRLRSAAFAPEVIVLYQHGRAWYCLIAGVHISHTEAAAICTRFRTTFNTPCMVHSIPSRRFAARARKAQTANVSP